MAGPQRVRLILEGLASEQGHVRLSDFLGELRRLNSSLVRADRVVSGGRSTYFRVVELRHSSPATVAVEPCPIDAADDYTDRILHRYGALLNALDSGEDLPERTDTPLLVALREMTNPLHKTLAKVKIQTNGLVVNLDHAFRRRISKALEREETFPGTIRGKLDAINVHGSTNVFYVYPEFGPKKVRCLFTDQQMELAKEGIGRFVEVSGQLLYKRAAKYPHAATVDMLEIFPAEEELPTLWDIQGTVLEFGDSVSVTA